MIHNWLYKLMMQIYDIRSFKLFTYKNIIYNDYDSGMVTPKNITHFKKIYLVSILACIHIDYL